MGKKWGIYENDSRCRWLEDGINGETGGDGQEYQEFCVAKVFLTIPDPTANKALSQIKQAPTKTNPTVFLKSPIHSPSANKSCSLLFTIVHGNSQGDSLSLTQNRNNSGGEFQGTRQGGYTSLQPTKG
ncbi:hypothetical protein Peur_037410 [Populus x canadensis]